MKYKPQIIGHRGAKGLVPFENTIESFQKAIEVGCDGIEFDIRKTKDNMIVIHHDNHVDNHLISTLNYDDLLNLSLSIGYKIPLLEEVLLIFKGKIYFDIEFKEYGYEEYAINLILKHLSYQEFCIRSFNDRSVRTIKKLNKNIKSGLLLGVGKARFGFISRIFELFPLFRIIYSKCDFLSPYYRLIILGFIKRMHILKKPVIAWTVNNEKVIKKLIRKKIDGIITDYPNIVLNILK